MKSRTPKRNDASKFTIQQNAQMAASLPFNDEQSFNDARQGQIASWPELTIKSDTDHNTVIWTLVPYNSPPEGSTAQTEGSTPPQTVNPSLWRQATVNTISGLFKVCEGIYQVRAFDMSNMTIIEGPTGLIIIDPLISIECARRALELYRIHRPNRGAAGVVTAIIYTHSHVDHFGGVAGVVKDPTTVDIYAPEGFLEHAVSENVYAGCAMGRRAQYMYGPYLEMDDKGQVDTGLGKGQSTGHVSLYPPNKPIKQTGQTENIAGLEVIFHMTPGSEAPAEMDFYFPAYKAFCAAENATHNMHNLQTLRGANVRDALAWSKYLGEALVMFGHEAEVMFASHHWPIWGQPNIANFLSKQRDMYRFLNDQTLRMLNRGYTGIEIAEVFQMPDSMANDWSCRGYYGSVSHNVKAVYDKYLGWFDGDPTNLHRLTPEDAAPKYVTLMGGPEAVIKAAIAAGENGEYRWAAELLRHVVFAHKVTHKVEPIYEEAKRLQADMLEQMGYQAENATWRNFFLMGAQELRTGIPKPVDRGTSPTMVASMTLDMIFDALGTRILGPVAAKTSIVMNWIFTDTDQVYQVRVENGALSYVSSNVISELKDSNVSHKEIKAHRNPKNPSEFDNEVTITMERQTLNDLMSGAKTLQDVINDKGLVTVDGDLKKLLLFFCLLDDNDPSFPIVTPRSNAQHAWSGVDKLEDLLATDLMSHPRVAKARLFFGELPRGC